MIDIFKLSDGINGTVIDNTHKIKDSIKNHKFLIGYKKSNYGILKSMMFNQELSLDEYIKYCRDFTLCIPFMYSENTALVNEYNKKSYNKIRELYDYLDDTYGIRNADHIYAVTNRIKVLLNQIPSIKKIIVNYINDLSSKGYSLSHEIIDKDVKYTMDLNYMITHPFTSGVKCDDITIIAPIAFIVVHITSNGDNNLSFSVDNSIVLYNLGKSKIGIVTDENNTCFDIFQNCLKINSCIDNYASHNKKNEDYIKNIYRNKEDDNTIKNRVHPNKSTNIKKIKCKAINSAKQNTCNQNDLNIIIDVPKDGETISLDNSNCYLKFENPVQEYTNHEKKKISNDDNYKKSEKLFYSSLEHMIHSQYKTNKKINRVIANYLRLNKKLNECANSHDNCIESNYEIIIDFLI